MGTPQPSVEWWWSSLNYKVAVASSIDWHCVQRSAVLCFRVLSVVIFGYFCIHIIIIIIIIIIISSTWGLHLDACHVVPHKEVGVPYKRFKIIAVVEKNSSEKQIDS
jgi:hypothetical protein